MKLVLASTLSQILYDQRVSSFAVCPETMLLRSESNFKVVLALLDSLSFLRFHPKVCPKAL